MNKEKLELIKKQFYKANESLKVTCRKTQEKAFDEFLKDMSSIPLALIPIEYIDETAKTDFQGLTALDVINTIDDLLIEFFDYLKNNKDNLAFVGASLEAFSGLITKLLSLPIKKDSIWTTKTEA